MSIYQKALEKGDGRKFEVVHINHDKDKAAHQTYMMNSRMNFPSVKHAERETSAFYLAYPTAGQRIPGLFAVSPSGEVLSADATSVLNMMKKDLN